MKPPLHQGVQLFIPTPDEPPRNPRGGSPPCKARFLVACALRNDTAECGRLVDVLGVPLERRYRRRVRRQTWKAASQAGRYRSMSCSSQGFIEGLLRARNRQRGG